MKDIVTLIYNISDDELYCFNLNQNNTNYNNENSSYENIFIIK